MTDSILSSGVFWAALILKLNLILTFVGALTLLVLRIPQLRHSLSALWTRRIHRAAILAALSAFVITPLLPAQKVFPVAIQVAPDFRNSAAATTGSQRFIVSTAMTPEGESSGEIEALWIKAAAALLIGLTAGSAARRLLLIARDRRRLGRIIARAFVLRKFRNVSVLSSDIVTVPFATRWFGRAVIVVPSALLADWLKLRLVVQHELQHHRQGDLAWSPLLEIVRIFTGWNPAVRHWLTALEECDELCCDEALLGRPNFNGHDYATCLFQVAKYAHDINHGATTAIVGTAGMAVSPQFLKRRIESMFLKDKNPSTVKGALIATAIALTTCAMAWAGEGVVEDRSISLSEASVLARKASQRSGIPIVVNQRVLQQLNRAVATPRARFWMRNSLKRMRTYEPMILAKLKAASLPSALIAVPLFESGYQNTETHTSAGIWQFIPSTARNFGLKVNDQIDERLDAVRETDAAAAYLSAINEKFGNWHLALLSYNAGENFVADVVAQAGHADVFKLADEGRLNKENGTYVPKFMAALIILENPNLVKD